MRFIISMVHESLKYHSHPTSIKNKFAFVTCVGMPCIFFKSRTSTRILKRGRDASPIAMLCSHFSFYLCTDRETNVRCYRHFPLAPAGQQLTTSPQSAVKFFFLLSTKTK